MKFFLFNIISLNLISNCLGLESQEFLNNLFSTKWNESDRKSNWINNVEFEDYNLDEYIIKTTGPSNKNGFDSAQAYFRKSLNNQEIEHGNSEVKRMMIKLMDSAIDNIEGRVEVSYKNGSTQIYKFDEIKPFLMDSYDGFIENILQLNPTFLNSTKNDFSNSSLLTIIRNFFTDYIPNSNISVPAFQKNISEMQSSQIIVEQHSNDSERIKTYAKNEDAVKNFNIETINQMDTSNDTYGFTITFIMVLICVPSMITIMLLTMLIYKICTSRKFKKSSEEYTTNGINLEACPYYKQEKINPWELFKQESKDQSTTLSQNKSLDIDLFMDKKIQNSIGKAYDKHINKDLPDTNFKISVTDKDTLLYPKLF